MTKVGAKNSIMFIVSIVSTQVASRLHHLHKREGQFDIFIIEYLQEFFMLFCTFDEKMMVREGVRSKLKSHLLMGNLHPETFRVL